MPAPGEDIDYIQILAFGQKRYEVTEEWRKLHND
jgi:hypothetical protein